MFLKRLPGQDAYTFPLEEAPEQAIPRLCTALVEVLALLDEAPVVLVLDDLQWADPLTLALVAHVARERPPRLLVLGTWRVEEETDALAALRGDAVVLSALPAAAIGDIVQDMLALDAPPPALTRALLQRAGGTPLLAAETLRAAVDAGLLERDDAGRWQVHWEPDTELGLPDSVQGIIQLRLRATSTAARKVVAAASVLGLASEALLAALTGLAPEPLAASLVELARREVLAAAPDGRLRFSHDRLREVALAELTGEARATLHLRAALALEADANAEPGDVARHWDEAGDRQRGRPWHLRAAERAIAQLATDTIAHHLRAFVASARSQGAPELRARRQLALHVLHARGRSDEARAELESALEAARALEDAATSAHILEGLALLHFETGDPLEALARAREALALLNDSSAPSEVFAVWTRIATSLHLSGSPVEAEAAYDRCEALAADLDEVARVTVAMHRAILLAERGALEASEGRFRAALAGARRAGHLPLVARILVNLGKLHDEQGRLEDAEARLDEALPLLRSLSDRRTEAHALDSLGWLAQWRGDHDMARGHFRGTLRLARQLRHARLEVRALCNLANLCQVEGDLAGAEDILDEADVVASRLAVAVASTRVAHLRAVLHDLRGEPDDARQAFEAVLASHTASGNEADADAVRVQLAALLRRAGEPEEAAAMVTTAERRSRDAGNRPGLVRALCERGHQALAGGASAEGCIAEAEALATTGQSDDLARLREAQAAWARGEVLVDGELRGGERP